MVCCTTTILILYPGLGGGYTDADLCVVIDQQIGQLYELMQAIKNPEGEGKE